MLSVEEIARDALSYADIKRSEKAGYSRVRALFRKQDESHLFPVRGRFNVTERAIRQLDRAMRDGLILDITEYAYALDDRISAIVNHPSTL